MKRLILCFLVLCLCLCSFAACKQDKEEIPKGFQSATCEGETFRFYIPSTWNKTVAYGVSGGYYNLSTTSVVRLKEYVKEENSDADGFYAAALRPALLSLASDLVTVEEPASALLGPLDAKRFHESGSVSGEKLHFLTYVGSAKEAFYVLTFTAADSVYGALFEDVSGMAKEFLLGDAYAGSDKPARTPNDKVDAPAGMILVSSDDVSYRFFVPDNWEFDESLSISEAHVKTGDANLSVVPYLPEATMTVAEFLATQNGQLVTAYSEGYTKLGEGEGKLGDRSATVVDYRITADGKTYRVHELVTAYRGMMYSFTYTATEETYDLYLADFGLALSAFTFR